MLSVRTSFRIAVIAAVLAGAATLSARQTPPAGRGQGAGAPQGPRINALVVSGGGYHDYPLQAKVLMDTISKALPVDWTDRDPGRPRHDRQSADGRSGRLGQGLSTSSSTTSASPTRQTRP